MSSAKKGQNTESIQINPTCQKCKEVSSEIMQQ